MSRGMCIWFYMGLMAATLTFSGCGAGVSYDKTEYLLDPRREKGPVAASPDAVLEVRRFMIDSAFGGKGLVYRTDDLQYESDFRNEFLVAPVTLIREAARNWLAQSNLFERVADAGSYVEPTFALEGNITALYGDVRDKSAPQAVVELRAFFLKVRGSRDPMMIFNKTYTATRDIEEQDPSGLVAAFNSCLQTILTELEADIAATL